MADACKLTETILKALGDPLMPEGKAAGENLGRAWTLLLEVDGEVSATGQWLERSTEDVAKRYPSLFAAGRAGAGRPKKKAAEPTRKTEEG